MFDAQLHLLTQQTYILIHLYLKMRWTGTDTCHRKRGISDKIGELSAAGRPVITGLKRIMCAGSTFKSVRQVKWSQAGCGVDSLSTLFPRC
jgi:hypothetical protein